MRTIAPRRQAVGVFHHSPGAEAQVDLFRGAPTLHAATGEWRRPWVFRMTLCHSRHGYEEAVDDQKLETFLRLHEHAFRDFGGVPRVVRHDNLKAAVTRACFYDPDSNTIYQAFSAHWGFTALPTQPRHPEENGKQERSCGYAGQRALVRSTFDLVADFAQADATGTRRELVQQLTHVDLLVLDDFGMKKLGSAAAEDLLEVFVRRHDDVTPET